MTTQVHVRPGAYADSVTLLQVSKDVATTAGVEAAQVAMATPLNLDTLASMGFDVPECSPNDMLVALRLADDGDLDAALAAVDAALAAAGRRGGDEARTAAPHRTVGVAIRETDGGLVLVSVPGPSAFVEAMDAVDAGRDVMVFSDNVPVDQEVALKRAAERAGVLVMGPDCGTAVVGGVGLGFANVVRPGPVGVVAASGTGCQQVIALLDQAGVGISAALGVGGRDLSREVGGISTRQALRMLDEDPGTEHVVVVSKPPAPDVAEELTAYAATLDTPVTFALLGEGRPDLTAATESLLSELGHPVPDWRAVRGETTGTGTGTGTGSGSGYLCGLFVGGTLCDESMLIAGRTLGPIHSNIAFTPDLVVDSSLRAAGHLMVDFGDDTLTAGRAHPMIDPTLRTAHLADVAADPETAVVLLDVVLGHGSEPDPAAGLAPAIAAARRTAQRGGRTLPVVVSCVGTDQDPQDLDHQMRTIADAGAEVFTSHAQATRRAVDLVTSGGAR